MVVVCRGFEEVCHRLLFGMMMVEDEGQHELGEIPRGGVLLYALARVDLLLVIVQDTQCGGLAPPRAETLLRGDVLPQDGGDLEADEEVEDLARLLGVDEIHVDDGGMRDGMLERRLGDFVKFDAFGLFYWQTKYITNVPGDGFALAIVV